MQSSCRGALRRGAVAALTLLFAAACGATSLSHHRGRDWLTHYYQQPEPERFVAAVFEMSRTRYFALPGHAMMGVGFLATLFQQNPERVDEWLLHCRRLPEAECRMVVAALWYAGYPKGEEYLQLHAELSQDERLRALLDRILTTSPSLETMPLESRSALYLSWGRFLATGDAAVLERILTAMPRLENLSVRDRWWLVCEIARHESAIAWCRAERDRQPPEVRESMEWVMRAADGLAAVD